MEVFDQLGRGIQIPENPKRIISLVPSQTELLVSLGLEDRLVGVTKFCVHPNWIKQDKAIVGGTKNYRFDVIDNLQPDLIIGNKEENEQAGIDFMSQKYPVWLSDIYTLEDTYEMITLLGEIFQVQGQAKAMNEKIRLGLAGPVTSKGSAVYLIWNDPMMAAGKNTFIDHMLGAAGFENAMQIPRYPELTTRALQELNPEYLLLSSEPFPFKQKHVEYFAKILPATKVYLVDGEFFSWYGSRLLSAGNYFKSLS